MDCVSDFTWRVQLTRIYIDQCGFLSELFWMYVGECGLTVLSRTYVNAWVQPCCVQQQAGSRATASTSQVRLQNLIVGDNREVDMITTWYTHT